MVGAFGFGKYLAVHFHQSLETIDAEITRSYLAAVGQSPNTHDNAPCGNNSTHGSRRRRAGGQDIFHDKNAPILDIFGEAALENKGWFLEDQVIPSGTSR